MERSLSNVQFAAGSYSVMLTVDGPATEKEQFEHTLDKMFHLWCAVAGAGAIGIDKQVKNHAARGDDHLKSTAQNLEYVVGDNTITLRVAFLTDTEGLDEVEIAKMLAKALTKVDVVLDKFAEASKPKVDFLSGLLGDLLDIDVDGAQFPLAGLFGGQDGGAPFGFPLGGFPSR